MVVTATDSITPNQANPLLKGFSEVAAPAEVSWLPQTLGWQLVLLLIVSYLLYRVYLIAKRYIANAYRRAALVKLLQLGDEATDVQKIPQLLRRTALYAYDRELVTPLIGNDWEQWLDQECKGATFAANCPGILNQLAYAPDIAIEPSKLVVFKQQVAHWIKNHRGQHD
ncbi:DUF4381 domain-containing protein [Thalassomonas sp. M1454]|uniref:DUF4381 domain-containing protein n=1 Tax=Thalassomonas sp. M1454 TaxID=2594477 RepID=UPI00117F2DF7|nr:DUF4381 domain-containing protein [Thalassomonas sp. M1454]TRX54936.1 DUF4381 domain-containing protein [Thalassomonas sp. M1454]